MEKQIKTIGVLTSGGDAPGMNAAVRAVVRTGLHKGFRMIGIQRGYNGLLNGECFEMNLRSVSNIISAGGTILYTARCLEFKTKEGQDKGAEKCRELGIDALVVSLPVFWVSAILSRMSRCISNSFSGSSTAIAPEAMATFRAM